MSPGQVPCRDQQHSSQGHLSDRRLDLLRIAGLGLLRPQPIKVKKILGGLRVTAAVVMLYIPGRFSNNTTIVCGPQSGNMPLNRHKQIANVLSYHLPFRH